MRVLDVKFVCTVDTNGSEAGTQTTRSTTCRSPTPQIVHANATRAPPRFASVGNASHK